MSWRVLTALLALSAPAPAPAQAPGAPVGAPTKSVPAAVAAAAGEMNKALAAKAGAAGAATSKALAAEAGAVGAATNKALAAGTGAAGEATNVALAASTIGVAGAAVNAHTFAKGLVKGFNKNALSPAEEQCIEADTSGTVDGIQQELNKVSELQKRSGADRKVMEKEMVESAVKLLKNVQGLTEKCLQADAEDIKKVIVTMQDPQAMQAKMLKNKDRCEQDSVDLIANLIAGQDETAAQKFGGCLGSVLE